MYNLIFNYIWWTKKQEQFAVIINPPDETITKEKNEEERLKYIDILYQLRKYKVTTNYNTNPNLPQIYWLTNSNDRCL